MTAHVRQHDRNVYISVKFAGMSETLPIIYEPSSAHLLYGLFEEDVISVRVYCSCDECRAAKGG